MKLKEALKVKLAKFAALLLAFGCVAGAWADTDPDFADDDDEIVGGGGGDSPMITTITIAQFMSRVAETAPNGTYNGEGATVNLKEGDNIDSSWYLDHNTDGREMYLLGTASNPRTTPITIKNVKFAFDNTAVGSGNVSKTMGQVYVYTTANVTFEDCTFNNVGVSFDGVAAADLSNVTSKFVNCSFTNLANYAIKYVYNTEITGCEFSDVKRSIMVSPNMDNAPVASSVKITDNSFVSQKNQDRVIKFYQFVADSNTRVEITGNDVNPACLGAFIQVDFGVADSVYNAYDYGTTVFTISDNTNITSENLNESGNKKTLALTAPTDVKLGSDSAETAYISFADLAASWGATYADGVITLNRDVSAVRTYVYKDVEIDFNGYTLTFPADDNRGLYLDGSSTMTLKTSQAGGGIAHAYSGGISIYVRSGCMLICQNGNYNVNGNFIYNNGGTISILDGVYTVNTANVVIWTGSGTSALSGGYFNVTRDITSWVAEGKIFVEQTSGDYVGYYAIEDDPNAVVVAQVGDTQYYSLQNALNAGGTVTLLRNVVLGTSEQLIVNENATLELNGFSITRPTGGSNQMMEVYAYLTVQDSVGGGVISNGAEVKCAVRVRPGATLELKSGTISGDWYDVYNWSGTVIATGGTFLGQGTSAIFNYSGGSINISGTTQFPCGGFDNWSPSTVSLTGGSYAIKPDPAFIASGYVVNYGATMYEVVPEAEAAPLSVPAAWVDADVIEIGTSMQLSLWVDCMQNNLIDPSGKTLKLTADITLPANITYYANNKTGIKLDGYTIDGDGHTLTVTGATADYCSAIWGVNGTVKNLTVNGAQRAVFITSATGDVVLENVTLDCLYPVNTGESNQNCKLIVKDSTLKGWSSFALIDGAEFSGCTFVKGNGYNVFKPYVNVTVEECVFDDEFWLDNTSQAGTTMVVGCTKADGSIITLEYLLETSDNEAAGTVVYGAYVAQIVVNDGATTNKYTTIADAIAAVPNNTATTITILADVDLGTLTQAQVTAAGNAGLITIPAGKVITLDLNGHRLYGTLQAINSGYNKNHVLLNSGTLTVVDSGTGGSIENLGTECVDCCYTIENASGATMYLNGGTFSTASGALMINRGTCEINSGVEMTCAGWYRGAYSNASSVLDNRGTVTINGGTFESTHEKSSNGKEATATIFAYGSTTINGGTFIGQPENGVFGGTDSYYTITGGSFSSDPQNLVDSTAYYVRESSGMYTVAPIVIEEYNVATSAELLEKLALADAEGRFVKCKLTSDITLSDDVAVAHGSQIELNGHTITIGDGVILSNDGTIISGNDGSTVRISRTGFLTNPYGGVDNDNVELVYANEADENGVYEISTPMDLQWLSYFVNTADFIDDVTKIVFANDIAIPSSVTFEMIGGIDNKEIDGNGKSVSGVVINGISGEYGMFEYLAGVYIHDLNVTASVSTVNAQTGILAARIKGGTTVKNVTVNGRIDVSGSAFGVAGFAGAIGGGSGEVRIVGCTNNADIYAPNATIAGGFHGTSSAFANGIYYISCENTGDMTSGGYAAQSWGYGYDKLYLYDFTGSGTMVGATVFTGAQGGPEGTGNIIAASKVARTGTPTSPTFHDNLASAITAAAANGSTIMLLTDCADAYELTVGSTLVIDEVAGECTGLTAPSGYVVDKTVNGTIATYSAVVPPVAQIGAAKYTTVSAALHAAQSGDTIEILPVTVSEGDVYFPQTLTNVTIMGSDGTILKDTIFKDYGKQFQNEYEQGDLVYEDITFTNLTFTGESGLYFEGWSSSASHSSTSYKNWAIVDCTFTNITTSSAAINFNMDKGDVDTGMVGFTFVGNVISNAWKSSRDGGSALILGQVGSNPPGDGAVSGAVLIERNIIMDVGHNALQIQGLPVGSTLTITNNYLSSAGSGVVNLNKDIGTIVIAENAIVNETAGKAGLKNVHSSFDVSNNYWGGGEPTFASVATGEEITSTSYYSTFAWTADWFELSNLIAYVAQIGNTKYTNLAEAITAAVAAGVEEITILDDSITSSPDPDWFIYGDKLKHDSGKDLWYVEGAKATTYATYALALAAANDDATKVFCLWSGYSKSFAEAIAAGSLVIEKRDRFEIEGYTGETAGFLHVKDARGLASLAGFKDYCIANCRPGPTDGKDSDDAFYWVDPSHWTVVLDCNIDLDNKAWTTIETGMASKFDGGNHTILNLSVSNLSAAGLFTNCGSIRNLKVKDATVAAADGGTAGTVVAFHRGGALSNVIIENATVSGKYVGGIAGVTYSELIESNALKNVSVTTTHKYVGGITGQFQIETEAPAESIMIRDNVLSDIRIAYSTSEEIYGSILGAWINAANKPYSAIDNTADTVYTNGVLAVHVDGDVSEAYNNLWAPRRSPTENDKITYVNNVLTPMAKMVTFELGTSYPTGAVKPADGAYAVGAALPLPTYTADNASFAGWQVKDSAPAVIIAVLPADVANSVTLVATWTVAKTVQVTEGVSEAQDIKVTEDWLEDKGLKNADDTAIQTALNATDTNGLPAWQNYVLGQDPNAAVAADVEQGSVEEMPIVSTVTPQNVDTGFKVEYKLVTVDTNGDPIAESALQPTPDLTVDLTKLTSEDNVAYYKTVAVITSTTDDSVTVTVESTNTVGVLAITDAPAKTIIPVPWESLEDGKNISVSNLVRTATLAPGDKIQAYDAETGNYWEWTLNANKEWVPSHTATSGGTESADSADQYTIPRGAGVWLLRGEASANNPIYLVGEAASGDTTSTLEGGTKEDPTWNLVGNPTAEDTVVDVTPHDGDQILVPTGGAPINYTYDASYNNNAGGWYYITTEPVYRKGKQVGVRSTRQYVDNVTIPAGTGFWYLNAGEDSSVTW